MRSIGAFNAPAWYAVRLGPRWRDGNVVGVTAIATDITQRKLAEEKHRAARARLEAMLGFGRVVHYARSAAPDFATIFVSDNVGNLLGFDAAEILAESRFWLDHVHGEDRESVISTLEHGGPQEGQRLDYRMRCKDGSYVRLRDEWRTISEPDGQLREFIGHCSAISDA